MGNGWLADIVVVNENRDEATVGDVSVYRSVGEACRALEHWWVENGEGFAFTASGDRLVLAWLAAAPWLSLTKRLASMAPKSCTGGFAITPPLCLRRVELRR